MPERYTDRIKSYCEAEGIEIPSGFFRHPASRYVAIEIGGQPPRLVAKTWFKKEDLVYYLDHLAPGRTFRLLDFKERQELNFCNGQLFRRAGTF